MFVIEGALLYAKMYMTISNPACVFPGWSLQLFDVSCAIFISCVNSCLCTFMLWIIIHFQFICHSTEETSNKYSYRVNTRSQHFSGRWEIFKCSEDEKTPGGNLHSAHQRAKPLSFQSLHYSLCVHFLLIRLTVWCISLTWHTDADKTVANLLGFWWQTAI